MKRSLAVVLLVLAAVPLSAAHRVRIVAPDAVTFSRVDGPRGGLAELMAQLRATRNQRHASVIASSRSSRAFIIPAAGSLRGAGNTFFRSDVTLVNYASHAQGVLVVWVAQGGAAPQFFLVNLPASSQAGTFPDFVGTQLGMSGLGSLFFIPVDERQNIDLNGAIDGFSRIWTPQPGATGTVSQQFPAVDPDAFDPMGEAYVLGLRHDAGYRTNYGIVNADSVTHTFTVNVAGERGTPQHFTVTVPGPGMVLTSIPAGDYGNLYLSVETESQRDDYSWISFASSTDNTTGDGWVSIGAANFSPQELDELGQ
jgi:hypothetical protein